MVKRYSIVGQKFRGIDDPYLVGTLPGEPVTLVREPGNQYDPNAVQVWIAGRHVGYLSKKENVEIAARIDAEGFTKRPALAQDGWGVEEFPNKAISAKFARSPNSGYPMVEV